jgi:crotonobetainyl-CoA:carnitine CoA-transferase CaiB-like acyl-CoA transferase
MAPHGIYPAAGDDRWLSIAVRDDDDWTALAAVAAGQDWASDPRFADAASRIADCAALDDALGVWTATQDRDSLVADLRAGGVPASPVNDIDGLWADRQIAARRMADTVELPGIGPEVLFRAPWNVGGLDIALGTRGPMVGEDNERVLRGMLGLSAEEFERLIADGVIA